MTTKTKRLPDGMKPLLERIGKDTLTTRLCEEGDWPEALRHVRHIMGSDLDWRSSEGTRRQDATNAPRAEAYASLSAMLEELNDGSAT